MITNIDLDLYFYNNKLLHTLNEISTSLQMLLSGNEKCDDDTDDDDADGQRDPYVSAMLGRRHINDCVWRTTDFNDVSYV